MNHYLKTFCVTILTVSCATAFSQEDTIRFKMIQTLSKRIKSDYVSGRIARQMCDTINSKFDKGGYDSSLNLDEFAFEITKDLRRVSHDEHITVMRPIYKPFEYQAYSKEPKKMTNRQWNKQREKSQRDRNKFWEKYKRRTKDDMFDYGEIKILPGNIGYVEIRDFGSTSYDRKQNKNRIAIETVMNFLKNTHSIIIDLRDNQGGFIRQAAKFCSFFSPTANNYFLSSEWHSRYDSSGIEKEFSYLDTIYTSGKIDDSFTRSKSIYILTSARTFSAAELSIYKIKQLKPETKIIGEKTKGGGNGHPGAETEKYFSAIIPSMRTFDENNLNYTIEGKGITPDILTHTDSAFVIAYRLALENAAPASAKTKYFKKQNAKAIANDSYFEKYYQDYAGDYRKIRIALEGSNLFMFYDTDTRIQLQPKAIDYFVNDRHESITFLRDATGHVNEIQVKHTDEFTERFSRQ